MIRENRTRLFEKFCKQNSISLNEKQKLFEYSYIIEGHVNFLMKLLEFRMTRQELEDPNIKGFADWEYVLGQVTARFSKSSQRGGSPIISYDDYYQALALKAMEYAKKIGGWQNMNEPRLRTVLQNEATNMYNKAMNTYRKTVNQDALDHIDKNGKSVEAGKSKIGTTESGDMSIYIDEFLSMLKKSSDREYQYALVMFAQDGLIDLSELVNAGINASAVKAFKGSGRMVDVELAKVLGYKDSHGAFKYTKDKVQCKLRQYLSRKV